MIDFTQLKKSKIESINLTWPLELHGTDGQLSQPNIWTTFIVIEIHLRFHI